MNRDITLSFLPEQLRTPEIRISLIKPLVWSILAISSKRFLEAALRHAQSGPESQYTSFGTFGVATELSISTNVVYVLLLLRYEYIIESKNNLIIYDLFVTKANICEVLVIWHLREYRSSGRISLLFITPMRYDDTEHPRHTEQLRHTKHLQCFNTLELFILSKSMKFLAQPAVVQILDRIYSSELMVNEQHEAVCSLLYFLPGARNVSGAQPCFRSAGTDTYFVVKDTKNDTQSDSRVVNYKFNHIAIDKVLMRYNTVPKFQALVIKLKYAAMTVLLVALVLRNKGTLPDTGVSGAGDAFAVVFLMVALSFIVEVAVKFLHIEFMFLKRIIWTYVDICIMFVIDASFVMRVLYGLVEVDSVAYYNCFSLISILLIPPMLSVFNNYRFFNMIFGSLLKMLRNRWPCSVFSFL